jgi:adenylate cyclase, class 2
LFYPYVYFILQVVYDVHMYEIELKAHVTDRNHVISVLNGKAEYAGGLDKKDTYYHFRLTDGTKSPSGEDYLSCRIRRETRIGPAAGVPASESVCTDESCAAGSGVSHGEARTDFLFTYKRKEIRTGNSGIPIEVNDEKECTLSEPGPVEALLADAGFTVARTKHKITQGWFLDTAGGNAHIELCTVPPLGDFLEIEIMSSTQDTGCVDCARKAIEGIFTMCGIPPAAVEPRYYSEMLAAAGENP